MSALIDQLILQGVRDFFVAPGSRNSPLIASLPFEPNLHYDERGLGFYALGRAKKTGRPAVLIVTSGTAVGNLLPSVMEAHHSEVPLILLTADRPAELRECGANQTTRQFGLFAPFVRWQFELDPSLPEEAVRSFAAHAIFQSKNGPVHLNCPFRNLTKNPCNAAVPIALQTATERPLSLSLPPSRGAIFVGGAPHFPDLKGVERIAQTLNWPLLADPLSGIAGIRHYETILKTLRPDVIFHFGGPLLSQETFDVTPHTYIHFHTSMSKADLHRATQRILTSVAPLVEGGVAPDSWIEEWKERERECDSIIQEVLAESPFSEPHLASLLPDLPFFVGPSLPIRDLAQFGRISRLFGNRGLSGIDGNIATAAGMNLPALIGDQTALHDLNSLPLLNAPLIISNNQGGRIFETLSHIPSDRRRWIASHSYHFEGAARMFNIPYTRVETRDEFLKTWQRLPCLIEVVTDPHLSARIRSEVKKHLCSLASV